VATGPLDWPQHSGISVVRATSAGGPLSPGPNPSRVAAVRLKTGILAAGLALTGLLASFATDHVQIPLNPRWADQLTLDLVLLHRPRPCSEAVLAFALAAAIGAYLRRTLAAPRHIV
jgi:hypothetical protein